MRSYEKMKMMEKGIMKKKMFALLLVGLMMKGCPILLLTSSKYRHRETLESTCYSLKMDGVVNRWMDSPWPCAPNDGYREWRSRDYKCGNYVFNSEMQGRIVSLAPGQSARIELPQAVDAIAVAALCSGYGLGGEALPFTIAVQDEEGKIAQVQLRAFDWSNAAQANTSDPTKSESLAFKIKRDGEYGLGQLGLTAAPYFGRVKSIEIRNDRAKENQYLLVSAVTLKKPPEKRPKHARREKSTAREK